MDISSENHIAAVITYYGIFLFHRGETETWAQAFSKRPTSLPPHGLPQAESIALSRDAQSIFAISEGIKTPIIRWHATP